MKKAKDFKVKGWAIAGNHNYISLYYDDKFIHCYDNSLYYENPDKDEYYMEHVIRNIEKRTGKKITEIPIVGCRADFDGLRFLHGGFKKGEDWLKEEQEIIRKWLKEDFSK